VPVPDDGPGAVSAARKTARTRLDAVRDDVAAALGLAEQASGLDG